MAGVVVLWSVVARWKKVNYLQCRTQEAKWTVWNAGTGHTVPRHTISYVDVCPST
jgi:hypothetical protein